MHTETQDVKIFGFWIYLMTDLVVFSVLFSAWVVLRHNNFGGPTAKELFDVPFALAETLILLTSSFTCSLATYSVFQNKKKQILFWFLMTFLLGLSFLWLEITEFSDFVHRGASWERSAFLSSFFALVGTHGFHIMIGLLWMAVMMVCIWQRPLTPPVISKIFRLAYFWHFLDVVWIFIFTAVYAMGHLL